MSTPPPEDPSRSWTLVDRSSKKRRRQPSDAQEAATTTPEENASSSSSSSSSSQTPEPSSTGHHVTGELLPPPPVPLPLPIPPRDDDDDGDDSEDPPIPTYAEVWAGTGSDAAVNQEDADMLLALQLTYADSDGEELDLANFENIPRRGILGLLSNDVRLGRDIPNDLDATTATAAAAAAAAVPLPEYTLEDRLHYRPALPRDRYDVAGISTYRVDPRGTHSLYRRFRQSSSSGSSSSIPQVAVASRRGNRSTIPSSSSDGPPSLSPSATQQHQQQHHQHRPSPLHPTTFFSSIPNHHPVLDPSAGSPLLNTLHRDSFLLILDNLYFPDIFALAMTCRALHSSINNLLLRSQKSRYRAALLLAPGTKLRDGAQASPSGRGLCEVCLYELPGSYFKARWSLPVGQQGVGVEAVVAGDEERKRPRLEPSGICSDCAEFRERVEAASGGGSASVSVTGPKSSNLGPPLVVWRPSHRVVVEGTAGFLWYRRRV